MKQMRKLLCTLLLVFCGIAAADDLSNANRLLHEKAYGKALPLYTKLANAGNAEAQFRLGEMYWYGDGTPMDLVAASAWFEKAAAAGNADAKESLAILKRRASRGGEIAYWTTSYAGEDLTSGKFDCKRPALPAVSKTNEEIKAASAALASWEACYNGVVANLNDAMPSGKRIPADVLEMMTPQEIERARLHLDAVYGKVGAKVQADADTFIAQRDAWNKATADYVGQQNQEIAARNEANKKILLMDARRLDESNRSIANSPVGGKPIGH